MSAAATRPRRPRDEGRYRRSVRWAVRGGFIRAGRLRVTSRIRPIQTSRNSGLKGRSSLHGTEPDPPRRCIPSEGPARRLFGVISTTSLTPRSPCSLRSPLWLQRLAQSLVHRLGRILVWRSPIAALARPPRGPARQMKIRAKFLQEVVAGGEPRMGAELADGLSDTSRHSAACPARPSLRSKSSKDVSVRRYGGTGTIVGKRVHREATALDTDHLSAASRCP